MSLIRQIHLLLLTTLVLAFIGSAGLTVRSARDTLETQLQLKNSDNAGMLAHVLGQQHGDPGLMELVMSAQFDTGFYRSIRFKAFDGTVRFAKRGDAQPAAAPAWFVQLLPIQPRPGVAQVSDGWRALGSVEVTSETAYAHDDLWRASLSSAAALAALGLVMALLSRIVLKRIEGPLARTVEQADALVDGRFLTVAEPRVPELQRLTQAMNKMVGRLKLMFEAQASQLEALRRQAHGDPLSGLSNRLHFIGQLNAARHGEDAAADSGMVLLRLLELAEVNRRLGRADTDQMIRAVAQAMQSCADRHAGGLAGRLNGADFALYLPGRHQAHETATAIAEEMRATLAPFGADIAVAIGAVEIGAQIELGGILAAADGALARAESRGQFAVEFADESRAADDSRALHGEGEWRQGLLDALAGGRGRLERFPVVDAQSQLIHLECPLRLQLVVDGEFRTAADWLPLALRSRLTSAIDELAVRLALEEVDVHGRALCVNVSPASLLDSGFVARLRGALGLKPARARRLSLEVSESAGVDNFDLLQEMTRQLRPLGVRCGLEHAGQRLSQIDRLFEAGLDYVKLDAAIVHGIDQDAARADFLRSLVLMLHGLSIQVIAEGVATQAESVVAWQAGVDGQTGPWISATQADLSG